MWKSIDKWVCAAVSAMTVCVTALVIGLVIAQIIFRYILAISVPWTEELARAAYIYVVFWGVVLLERDDGHIRTTMLIDVFPGKVRLIWEMVIAVCSIVFNVCLFVGSVVAFRATHTYLSALPEVPMKIFFIPILVGVPFLIVYQIAIAIGKCTAHSTGRKPT
jgi:TRAP-type C4-dicarboxylate transport system permease small subunit